MRTIGLIALIMVVVICVTPAYCQGGPKGPGRGAPTATQQPPPPSTEGQPPPPGVHPPPAAATIDSIAQRFALTTDQATTLGAILTTTEATMQPLMEAAATANKALQDAFAAADFDAAADLAASASNAELAVTKASLTAWAQIKDSGILTADQLTTLLTGPKQGGGPPPPRP